MERGWFQSNWSSGLKAPRVAALVRLSRLRASRSRRSRATRSSKHWTEEARDLVRCLIMACKASAEARIPSARRALTTSSWLGIIGLEVVRDDVAVTDVRGQRDVEGDGRGAGAAALLAERGEGAGVVQTAGDHLLDGAGEQLGAVEVEESQRPRSHGAEVAARIHPALVQSVDGRDGGLEAIAALGLPRAGALSEERLAVLPRLHGLAPPPAA